jgi:capsular polysaccharide biosynthesis protein
LNFATDPSQAEIYQHIKNHKLQINSPNKAPSKRKLFFSKNGHPRNQKAAINEEQIEMIFAKHGFEIIYPYKLELPEKVKLINESSIIAGCESTDLYLAVFSNELTKVIVLADRTISSSQVMLGGIANTETHFIHVLKKEKNASDNTFEADIAELENHLDKIMQQ